LSRCWRIGPVLKSHLPTVTCWQALGVC